ncbi:protein TIFY 5A-like [Prosopis cineraria]|uniref:protein TIFY 5A-like n=1 Tax=Prosopis cineraria TaxID=364024 RepID=UPI0024102ABE|nr:protein TIFY 5A-like [Prosopis cineraria]
MKRNCELELGLQRRNSINEPFDITHHHPQILHNGRRCFIDVTEIQARVIIWLANREMEERVGRRGSSSSTSSSSSSSSTTTTSSSLSSSFWVQSQALMYGSGGHGHGGLSLKKSLQSFLQKRKKRTQQETKSQCDHCE